MLDCLAVASLLLPRVWLKFVLELRLGCLVEFFFPWSANIVLSEPHFPPVRSPLYRFVALRVFRSTSRTSLFRSIAHCSLGFSSVPFPWRRALLARLPVHHIFVSSRVARSTSHVSFVSLCVERIAFSALLLFLSGTVCWTTFSALWVVCFTDRLQCALFGLPCVCFVLRGFGLFGVFI